MSKVVKRINAPLIALSVMVLAADAVDSGVSHIHIGRCHINFCTQSAGTVLKLAVFHSLKKVKVFLNASISIGALLTGLGKSSSILAHLFCVKVADVGLALADKLYGKLIALFKVV